MSEQAPTADSKPPLYSTREDWKDVKPIEQTDQANPLVPIFYPPDCKPRPSVNEEPNSMIRLSIPDKDAMDYFRGIATIGEHSERVLQLTEHIIRMNPAHYFVW
jgi:protein farnesyltransferase/geranylgeranyltransferase type-1 subunit alpha